MHQLADYKSQNEMTGKLSSPSVLGKTLKKLVTS